MRSSKLEPALLQQRQAVTCVHEQAVKSGKLAYRAAVRPRLLVVEICKPIAGKNAKKSNTKCTVVHCVLISRGFVIFRNGE